MAKGAEQKIIEALTSEQEARFQEFVEKWLAIGTNCDRIDREACIRHAQEAYKCANVSWPKDPEFLWAQGPEEAMEMLHKKWNIPRESVVGSFVYGQHEAAWLAFYDYCETVLGLDCGPLHGLMNMAKVCGWWFPTDRGVLFVEKHTSVRFNDRNEAHCDNGPAIAYADGTAIYIIDGIRVTEQIVMRPETLTVAQINEEQNNDVRTIMLNRYGWAKYLNEINADCIDERENVIEGTYEALFDTPRDGKRLVATCSTGRVVTLGVPPEIKTCADAQQWLSGSPEFKSIGRT